MCENLYPDLPLIFPYVLHLSIGTRSILFQGVLIWINPVRYLFWSSTFFTKKYTLCLTLFRWVILGLLTDGCPKICYTYPTMMKLGAVIPYLKKIQKIYKSRDRPPESCWNHHLFTRNRKFLLYQKIQIQIKFWYILYNYFNFF